MASRAALRSRRRSGWVAAARAGRARCLTRTVEQQLVLLAIVGNEAEIKDRLQATFDAGADDVIVAEFGGDPDQRDRTRAALASLL